MNENSIKMLNASHSDVAICLLGRGLMTADVEMEKDIGRRARYTKKYKAEQHANGSAYTMMTQEFTVVGVQKIFDGRVAYRVHFDGDTFGKPCLAADMEFLK